MSETRYPIGIQDFGEIRRNNYLYIDKTRHIYDLSHKGKYYFLGRPRRFGKSLLLSTMEAYFKAEKHFFDGLDIANAETEWNVHPVLHLDLNTADYSGENSLYDVLNKALNEWEKLYGASPDETTPALRLSGIVRRACETTNQQVVFLVDEYDKPILQTIDNEPLQERHRAMLKAFYSVLKSCDKYLRFAFLTGVTKFAKISIFSDLNNLTDITMVAEYADLCGVTETELHHYFDTSIHELAAANKLTFDQACHELKEHYDGYHFAVDTPGIYNPFSLLNALRFKTIGDYWFETGTPTFLVELLKKCRYKLENFTRERLTSDVLNSIEAAPANPIPLIYQSGYLTLSGYNKRFGKYELNFPNKEVETGFVNFLLPAYMPVRDMTEFDVSHFIEDVENGNAESFMNRLQAFFADVDYKLVGDREIHFHNSLFLVFKIIGFYTQVEYHSSHGSADIVVRTLNYIYVIECKLDSSAEVALAQIDKKGYTSPFAANARKVFKIGINFSSESRGIEQYIIK